MLPFQKYPLIIKIFSVTLILDKEGHFRKISYILNETCKIMILNNFFNLRKL